ncbi:hypothetical protein XM52_14835 [Roseovarius indicus]|uniref:Uncharacterized protein n=1 Tax=Roseovarius indicus TaxID=540747 RepID=A0A0T5P7Q1_9RHOB|nr:hypothetical protein XM52_14835 [Roseovarius indicus]
MQIGREVDDGLGAAILLVGAQAADLTDDLAVGGEHVGTGRDGGVQLARALRARADRRGRRCAGAAFVFAGAAVRGVGVCGVAVVTRGRAAADACAGAGVCIGAHAGAVGADACAGICAHAHVCADTAHACICADTGICANACVSADTAEPLGLKGQRQG